MPLTWLAGWGFDSEVTVSAVSKKGESSSQFLPCTVVMYGVFMFRLKQ
jgi:hypothetical protein